MALSVVKLRREYEVRLWSKIIEQNPYVAVVQVTGGRAWGRTNMKARLLGKHLNTEGVNTRYAVPRAAREGALRTRFNEMSTLFRSAGSAVIYGREVADVVAVVKEATKRLDGGVLLGGRFGNNVVTANVWRTVLESEGETAEWGKLVGVLARRPPVVDVLDRSAGGLLDALGKGGRARRLSNVLERMGETQDAQPAG